MPKWLKICFISLGLLVFLFIMVEMLGNGSDVVYYILVIVVSIVVVCGAIIFYFIPTIIANHRKHKNAEAIVLLNVFLGWTLLGWVICLIWAVYSQEPIKIEKETNDSDSNKYDNLEKLAKLKSDGTITEEEYKLEKEKLLK